MNDLYAVGLKEIRRPLLIRFRNSIEYAVEKLFLSSSTSLFTL
jgi:hypothetical protein